MIARCVEIYLDHKSVVLHKSWKLTSEKGGVSNGVLSLQKVWFIKVVSKYIVVL